jgi:hypothetical protein
VRVARVKKQVYLQARSDEALNRRIGTFKRALELRSGSIVGLERLLAARDGRAALICYELPVETLPAKSLDGCRPAG